MRDFRRKSVKHLRPALRRAADGRLRSAAEEKDIADIWAEQRRIKLAEAIRDDQRKAAAKRQGWKRFFKKKSAPVQGDAKPAGSSDEVVVMISLPKFKRPRLLAWVKHKLSGMPRKRVYIGGGILVFFLLLTFGGPFLYGKSGDSQDKKKAAATSTVLDAKSQKPMYETILPEGETIEDLGGWRRVSPPDKEPAFAYTDTISGVPIIVSEQPLPDSFKKDTAGELAKLAEQFSANEKVSAGDVTIYIGTSIKGPQSAVLAKRELLILIKSEAKIENQAWTEYVEALR